MRRRIINGNINNLSSIEFITNREFDDPAKYIRKIKNPKVENVLNNFPEFKKDNTVSYCITNTGLIIFSDNGKLIIYDLLDVTETTIDQINPDIKPIKEYDEFYHPLSVRSLKFEINSNGTFFLPKFIGINVMEEENSDDGYNREYDYTYQYIYNCDFLNGQRPSDDGVFRFVSDDDVICSNSLPVGPIEFSQDDDETESVDLVVTDGFNTSFKWFTPGFFYKPQFIISLKINENNIISKGLNLYMTVNGKKYYAKRNGNSNDYIFDFTNYPEIDTTSAFNLGCDDIYYKNVSGILEVR